MPAPDFMEEKEVEQEALVDFDRETLGMEWMTLRTSKEARYDLKRRKGYLKFRPETISKDEAPSIIVRRQQHKQFMISTQLEFLPSIDGEVAGLILIQNNDFHIRYGDKEKMQCLIEHVDATLLSSQTAGGFVGTCVGMYASSNDTQSDAYAEFKWFSYKELI